MNALTRNAWSDARAVSKDRNQMAAILNVTPKTVSKLLSVYGLERFGQHNRHGETRGLIIEGFRAGRALSHIAAEYNLTRSQVAGILHRAGEFKKRAPRIAKPRKVRPSYTTPRAPKLKREPFKVSDAAVVPLNIPFLENTGCKYLYGDDPREMLACGHPMLGVFPYCEAHCALAYRAPEERNRNPRPR